MVWVSLYGMAELIWYGWVCMVWDSLYGEDECVWYGRACMVSVSVHAMGVEGCEWYG